MKEKAQSSSFGGSSTSKVFLCVSLPATAVSEICPQLYLNLGPQAQEPRLRERAWRKDEERMAGAAVQLRLKFWHLFASECGKLPNHQVVCGAPPHRGSGSKLSPSRPAPKMGAPEQAILADPPSHTIPDRRASLGDSATVHTDPSSLPQETW